MAFAGFSNIYEIDGGLNSRISISRESSCGSNKTGRRVQVYGFVRGRLFGVPHVRPAFDDNPRGSGVLKSSLFNSVSVILQV